MTFSLVIGAAVIWVVLSIADRLARRRAKGSIWDPLLMILALIGISMPVFWLGEVANLVTQDRLHDTFLFSWVPPLGYVPLTQNPWQWFLHLIIPWLTLVGAVHRLLRARAAREHARRRQRGLRAHRAGEGPLRAAVLTHHMLRTSMITFVSPVRPRLRRAHRRRRAAHRGRVRPPRVGLLTYRSLVALDLPVIMATVIYGAFFITIANALVDIVYARLDPRIRPA